MERKYSEVIHQLGSAYFANTLMNSFMAQLDEVLVNRVRSVEEEIAETSERFVQLSRVLSDLQAEFDRSGRETRETVEQINRMNGDLSAELQRSGTDLEGMSENEKTWEGIRLLKEDILGVKEHKKENIISISARYKDPAIAQSIAATTLNELTDYMTAEAKRVASANMRHLETEIVHAADPFVRQKIYSLIAQQIETAMMAEAKENFAFKVIDPPRVPDKKVKPKRVLMVVLAFVVSLFLGILLSFIREHYQRNREEWTEIGRMSGLKGLFWKRSHA